jgi:ubiquinol-cytochrome c reductase cytochrome c subunit
MRRILAVVVVGVLAGGCAIEQRGPYRPAIEAAERPGSGRELYLRDCAWCHGADGAGTERGPDLLSGTSGPASVDFMLSTGRMPIDDPDESVQRREPVYSTSEIDAIVAYVDSLGAPGPGIPEPDPGSGSLAEGALLYQENCAACHSTTLIGGAMNAPPGGGGNQAVAPPLDESSPRQIAEAMLIGPGAMPVFGRQTFSSDEVDSIVRYIVHQQDPNDRGGAPLGHVGPVTEGAFGWVVGLGILLVFVRWIGTQVGE